VTNQISFQVSGYPLVKNEAKSIFAAGPMYAEPVLALLCAVRGVLPVDARGRCSVVSASASSGADRAVFAAVGRDQLFGGVGDVLEAKARRGVLDHLGGLATVELYANDRQIEEVRYRVERGEEVRYAVRIWVLDCR
jgi:hypothetical protein